MANGVIQVNYESLERIRKEFARCAEESARMHQRLKNGAGKLVGLKWEGEAARKFFNEMENEVLPAFGRLEQALCGADELVAALALQFRQAEEEAAALFKQDGDGTGSTSTGSGTGSATGAAVGGAVGSAVGGAVGGVGGGAAAGGAIGSGIGGAVGGAAGGAAGSAIGQAVSSGDYQWLQQAGSAADKISDVLINGAQMVSFTNKGLTDKLGWAGLGLGIAFDEDTFTNLPRALAGELPKFGAGLGAGALLGLAIGAGGATLVLGAVALTPYALHWLAGQSSSAGNQGLANTLNSWGDTVDFGDRLEKFSEGVYDGGASWLQEQARDFVTAM